MRCLDEHKAIEKINMLDMPLPERFHHLEYQRLLREVRDAYLLMRVSRNKLVASSRYSVRLNTESILLRTVILQIPSEYVTISKGCKQVLTIECEMAIAVRARRAFQHLH